MADMGTTRLVQVTSAAPAGHWRLRLTFSDGFTGTADLSVLEGKGVFGPLSDPAYFDQVRVDDELGTVVWPNGADIAPETLREWAESSASSTAGQRTRSHAGQRARSHAGQRARSHTAKVQRSAALAVSGAIAAAIIRALRRARM